MKLYKNTLALSNIGSVVKLYKKNTLALSNIGSVVKLYKNTLVCQI